MKTTWNADKQTLVKSGQAHTVFDGEPWFGGKSIQSLDNAQVANDLINAGVPGASHTNGRYANLECWAKYLDSIRKQAADKAVAEFLAGKPA